MRLLRVTISAWTASFRHPSFMIGFQPTLPIPPLSTVFGLISAAAGKPITPKETPLGFFFSSEGMGVDLERIIEIEPGKTSKSNILRREFLFNPKLTLYVDLKLKAAFQQPKYPLLLGRSSDLAKVDELKEVELVEKENVPMAPSIYTYPPQGCDNAFICALPVYFNTNIPRKAVGSRKFFLIKEPFHSIEKVWFDVEKGIGFPLYTEESLGL